MDFSKFKETAITDSHIHFIHPERMNEVLKIMDTVPYQRANLVCTPNPDGSNHNPAALYFKERYPDRIYICGALDYPPALADPANAAKILASQVRDLRKLGFDGVKMIEGKPMVRKLLPFPLDGPMYQEMWAVQEQERFPVVFHVADPDEFWDPQLCPDWARQNGWDYSDGSYPSKEDLYTEVEHILSMHPGLRIIFAHFYFLAHDLERAARFLETHPQVYFDLTPHLEMYSILSRQLEAARAFFVRYQDRILYGTDLDTRLLQRGPDGLQFVMSIAWLIRSFLETNDAISMPGMPAVQGVGLPQTVLEKIYHANFERLFGAHPAPLREQL